jgi:DNA-binding SARP family transcriptional activator
MFRLRTLGGALIEGPEGPLTGAVSQRRPLALLSLVAASRAGVSRDRVVALLWPESDDEHARTLSPNCSTRCAATWAAMS